MEILNPFISTMATEIKSISVSKEFADLAREFHLSWSEAAKVGMSVMLGDLGVKKYDNSINLFRKMDHFRRIAEDSLQKLEELQCQTKTTSKEEEKNIQ